MTISALLAVIMIVFYHITENLFEIFNGKTFFIPLVRFLIASFTITFAVPLLMT